MSWTLPEDKDWASIGFNVNAASAAGFTVTESGGSTSVAESGTTDTFTVVLGCGAGFERGDSGQQWRHGRGHGRCLLPHLYNSNLEHRANRDRDGRR